jgi:hypothetical protein
MVSAFLAAKMGQAPTGLDQQPITEGNTASRVKRLRIFLVFEQGLLNAFDNEMLVYVRAVADKPLA